ncbi:MAG: AmmeMemoRadiSam system radical SAM enzyme [archaeon]
MEARFYKKLKGHVKCELCPHECAIKDGQYGLCHARKNADGRLMSMVYGRPVSVNVDPIEKKPLYHFLPGSRAFSIGTAGCNLRCGNCQNWQISQAAAEDILTEEMPPGRVAELAIENDCASIAYTYNEPTIFHEYAADTAEIARKEGLKNVIVTNGYINETPLGKWNIDAANVDLKSFNDNFYRENCSGSLEPVLRTILRLKKMGVWVEITNLVIPGMSDDLKEIEDMCKWLSRYAGDTVIHFSRFFPNYKLPSIEPTPPETLERARKIALKHHSHVYLGNMETEGNNTYCPKCKELLVERMWYTPSTDRIVGGKCPKCGHAIGGVWA